MTREQLEKGNSLKLQLDDLQYFYDEFSKPDTEIECQRASGYKIRIPAELEPEMLKIRDVFIEATLSKIAELEKQFRDL